MAFTNAAQHKPSILVVQLSEAFGELWGWLAEELGREVRVELSSNGAEPTDDCAMLVLSAGAAERQALEWLDTHELTSGIPTVVVGVEYGRRWAVRSVRAGATDYFALPDDLPHLRSAVAASVDRYRRRGGQGSAERPDPFAGLVGTGPAMEAIRARAMWLARYESVPALILGESGTGRELLARSIHEAGAGVGAPFVHIDCGAAGGQRLALDLLGRASDGGRDTTPPAPGLLEMAEGGTAYFDDVVALPEHLQANIASILKTGTVRRVGSAKARRVRVRFLAAADDSVDEAVARGALLRELYDELSVIQLRLPPLRERGTDVAPIARALLERIAREYRLPTPSLSPDGERLLTAQSWEGNVEELKQVLVRATLLSTATELPVAQIEAAMQKAAAQAGAGGEAPRSVWS